MDLTTFDYVLLAAIGTLAVIGLFKGLSGWMGTLAGAGAGSLAGWLGFGWCLAAAANCPWVTGPFVRLAAALLDFLLALIAFGLVRRLAVKFISFLVPQPLNALIGMAGGLFLGGVLAVVLAGTAFFEGCALEDGFAASHSCLVRVAARALDAHLEGRAR